MLLPTALRTVTLTVPEACSGLVVLICVSDTTVNDSTLRPLKNTPVALVNPTPVNVTGVPDGPEFGFTELSCGVYE